MFPASRQILLRSQVRCNRVSQIPDYVLAWRVDSGVYETRIVRTCEQAEGKVFRSFILHGATEEVHFVAEVCDRCGQYPGAHC